jgi:tripartite motif-containing protein 71
MEENQLELVRTIGGLDAEENLSFNNPNDIVRDSVGNLYILDTDNNRIQKLNSEGKFIKTIGRKGQRPVEFQRARSMDIDEKDNIFVFDSGNARIQVISLEGRPLKTFKLLFSVAGRIRLLKSGLIVKDGAFYYSVRIERSKKLPKLLEIIDQNGRTKLAFGEATDYKDADVNSWANFVKYDTDAEKNIYLSFDRQNRIEKCAPDGTLLWRADRQLDYGTGYVKGGTKQGMPMNVVSRGIAADGKGRIWVITNRRQLTQEERGKRISAVGVTRMIAEPKIDKMDIYKLEIFSPEGVFLGEIPLNHLAGDIRIFGDTLFIWEYSNTTFYQYKIVEK